jgi:hypothetical protein
MAYQQKYMIRPDARGWGLWSYEGPATDEYPWVSFGSFKTKEEAEDALKRVVSKEEFYYDENGEAV